MLTDMQHTQKTAGETAPATIILVIIKDCHARHNEVVVAKTPREEQRIRLKAMAKGYLVAERKRKPDEPTCDNCDHMTIRTIGSGTHRHCDLMGLYIPDNEQSPTCDLHSAINKFERMMTAKAKARKGGAA